MNLSFSPRSLGLFAGAWALAWLLDQPAQAHGIAQGGIAAGFLHPLRGADHLLLLIGVGAAASHISPQLLGWGLAGAFAGAMYGAMGGTLPAQEVVAALAISAVAVLVLRSLRAQQAPQLGLCAAVVAVAGALHAMLHALETPVEGSAALWWLGAFGASLLVSGGSYLALRRLPLAWTRWLALLLALAGAVVALGPVGLGTR